MQDADREVFEAAARWVAAGSSAWLYTVVRTWGSSPRPLGSMLALREDGRMAGSVSGGCIEDDLVDRLLSQGPPSMRPSTVEYGLSADEAHRFGLPCGGTMRLACETLGAHSGLDSLLGSLCDGQLMRRTLDMRSGAVTLARVHAHTDADAFSFDGERLATVHGPAWRLLLIGAGQLSEYVALMALPLGYAVTVCDPREHYLDDWRVPGVACVRTMPDDTVLAMRPDARMAVIALTHDPKLDDLALMEALMTPAFFVGAIGSRRNSAARRERLQLFGVTGSALDALRAPVGIFLGGSTPPEIALSIVADLTARRNRVPVGGLLDVEAGKAIV
ncbi:Molybdenum cofactor insertion chaperone PaoD [Paraburkholderia hiiakae]|uniref:Molybdenum cofactor insertion chaperone PaoD n=1 Tax=Paraburkholderia hiiakae TaxID=1081782 RepID=A0ABN7HYL9_9BURK|nr:XdhC family protein [Paraburkholderia hiiakae]CAD6543959.1 Molybdenum cofactor insertion chaperone PaoD [Paraburkholderia hiiakae]